MQGAARSSSPRATLLMGAFVVLLLGYLAWSLVNGPFRTHFQKAPAAQPPLAGTNTISGLKVSQGQDGAWMLEFDYFYTGEPQYASMAVTLMPKPKAGVGTYLPLPERGAHHVSLPIRYPGSAMTTRQVEVALRVAHKNLLVTSSRVDAVIHWPTYETYLANEQFSGHSPEENLARAVELIETGDYEQIRQAKPILERIVAGNSQLDQPYVELARVAMKTNWGPEGLHEAESLLSSALQIRPDSVNAKILLGYVFTHQARYAKAEALFVEAAKSNPPNLWLWANWGELFLKQGKVDQALAKYREALARPMTAGTNEGARRDAYRNLLALLKQRRDLDGLEAAYKQRIAEFGPGSCYSSDYALFRLHEYGDAQGASELAQRGLNQNCDDSSSRQILGLAAYVTWSAAPASERAAALNQARIYLPAGPETLYLLARSDKTLPAAKQLIATGEQVDRKDNNNLTALALALIRRDVAAAGRLLRLGARPDMPIGEEGMPLALLPVMAEDVDAIRLMKRSVSTTRSCASKAKPRSTMQHKPETIRCSKCSGARIRSDPAF